MVIVKRGEFEVKLGRSMKRIIVNILIVFYVVITIPITFLLINYNDYDVSVFGNNTLLIPRKTDLVGYDKNSLLVVSKNIKNIKVGDTILYYDTYKSNVSIKNEKVASIIENPKTFIVGSESHHILDNYVIGTSKTVTVYPLIGGVIALLTSKMGYLFLIILPILILFILELYLFIMEVRKTKNEKN